jgi:transglutaminase-like putative cysteine protease
MKLRVHHRTEYLYSQPARTNSNEIRLQPPHTPWQTRSFWLLKVLPATPLRHYVDLHRNGIHHFEIEEPHSRLVLDATSTVITLNRYADGEPVGIPFSALQSDACREDAEVMIYQKDSRYVRMDPAIWRAAIDVKGDSDDIFLTAKAICEHLYDTCQYVSGVTTVNTTSSEFFQNRQGVCQDFAHLMLAMCRALGIPARYVSGYLYDRRRGNLRGAHQSHAWVEIFLPGHGWFGIDPTNRLPVNDLYVTLASGRDYDDAAPVKGSFTGSGSRTMKVTVSVEEL